MSWSDSDLSEDEAPPRFATPRAEDDSVLRDVCTYFHVTGTPRDVLKYYERSDGSPIVPGVDVMGPSTKLAKEQATTWDRFRKSLWRNTQKSMERRRQYPEGHKKHANSLPLHYSPHNFLRLKRWARHEDHPGLPLWTKEHYDSQFRNNMVSFSVDALKALICTASIGHAELLNVNAPVDGQLVDYHVRAAFTRAGIAHWSVNGTYFQCARIPRAVVLEQTQIVDVITISVISSDTSRPSYHIFQPFTYSEGYNKIFCSVKKSSAVQAEYAKARAAALPEDTSDARHYCERTFHTELDQLPDKVTTFCIEFGDTEFIPKLLQDGDDNFVELFERGIFTELTVAEGDIQEPGGGRECPFAAHGYDCVVPIKTRLDNMKSKARHDDYLAERFDKSVKISGAFDIHHYISLLSPTRKPCSNRTSHTLPSTYFSFFVHR